MKLFRAVVFAAATVLLVGGYLASQSAYIESLDPATRDATARYAEATDVLPVKLLALFIFFACVVLASTPQKEAEQ